MTTRTPFLTSVLAEEGLYCIVGLRKGIPKQTFVQTIDEIDAVVEGLISQGYDVYFACAKYLNAEDGRTAKNAKWFKAFWLDLDCGEGKPYATQADAVNSLRMFVQSAGLPKPTLINSGRGVHAYWTLTTVLSYNDWKPAAEAFKKFCATYNLNADPAVTADAARILRVPETLNFKDNPPKRVYVLHTAQPVDFTTFKQVIGIEEEPDDPQAIFGDATPPRRPIDATTRSLMGNNVSHFGSIMRKSAEGAGCAQLIHIYKNQETIEEPLWRAGLSIAANCEDGDISIHKLSSQHPEYDPQETYQKAQALLGKPYKCTTFASLNAAGCSECALRGKITSPIQIGSRIAEAKAEDNIVVMRSAVLEEEVTVEIPEYPFPYFRGKNGGVYKRGYKSTTSTEGEEEEKDTLIYEYDFYVVKRLTDPDVGECLWMRLHMPKDGIREFSAPLASVLSKDKLREILAYQGVTAYGKRLDAIMGYVTKWVQELQQIAEAEKARRQFGWHDNDTKFIIGNREITATGVNYSPSSSQTSEVSGFYYRKGDVREWSKVANLYAQPGNEARAFTLFAGFGSALFKFTKLNGAIIHLTNNGSGVGKTTIQLMINSIWGHPELPLMNEKDTILSRTHRIATLGNLPPTIDELTNMKDEEVSNMAYMITHGRGRGRMQSQVNAERSNPLRWSSIAITSGNKSLYDQLFNLKDFPEGELMRILEIGITKNDDLTKAQSDEVFHPMFQNHGIAGEIFIRYVIANLPEVERLLSAVQRKFDKAAGFTQRERFWSGTAACSITAGIITKRLGLHDINVDSVYRWAATTLSNLKDHVRADNISPISRIGMFLNEHTNNMLIVNSFVDKRNGTGLMEAPVREPRGTQLMTRYEPDTKLLYVAVKPLRDWCSKNQIAYKMLIDDLKKNNISKGLVKKSMSKGSDISTPSVAALLIDCTVATELDPDVEMPLNDGYIS